MGIKEEILQVCKTKTEEKIFFLKDLIGKVHESANSDTKSSMGDKYETGRAMAQLEIEKSSTQLKECQQQLEILKNISGERTADTVGLGAVAVTENARYFIATSLGEVKAGGESFMVMSVNSPLFSKMKGLKKGDKILFNSKEQTITEVY